MEGTSMLWVEGHISSYFLLVKMSIPTRFTCRTRKYHSEDELPNNHFEVVENGKKKICFSLLKRSPAGGRTTPVWTKVGR